jgi:hypothetical protein
MIEDVHGRPVEWEKSVPVRLSRTLPAFLPHVKQAESYYF